MKLLITLMIAGSALLIAGGDMRPVELVTKYEKVEVKVASRCFKPNIKKCPDCEDVAELCPYNGEDLPIAKTEACEGLNQAPRY
ncbi:MAG TPA: hypothetical protein EYM49_01135 [Campylobacterales bacterium]|nr:hypothetical protein [Campylobacterales bacterium]